MQLHSKNLWRIKYKKTNSGYGTGTRTQTHHKLQYVQHTQPTQLVTKTTAIHNSSTNPNPNVTE